MFHANSKVFEKTPVIHYIKQIETVIIDHIIVDVNNVLFAALRRMGRIV
jgi:hypothetical protein